MKHILLSLLITISCFSVSGSEMSDIAAKYREWIVGGANIDYSNAQVSARYNAILTYVKYGDDTYNDFEFDESEMFDFDDDQTEARDIFSDVLFPLSLGYHLESSTTTTNPYYHNAATLEKILFLFDYLYAKGWKDGIDMQYGKMDTYMSTGVIGFGGSMGNNFLGYSLSVFLNKDILADEDLLTRELSTLDWITNVIGPDYDFPVLWEVNGYNADGVRSMFNSRFVYALSLPDDNADKESEMLYFQKLFNKSLLVSDGFADLIKSDFMGYHHKGAYINAYAPNAFHTAAIMAYMLEGTSYQVGDEALSNLSNAILTTRIYSNKYDVPRGLAGRFPTNLDGLINNQPYFYYMSQVDTPLKDELAGAFMRLWDVDIPTFQNDFIEDVTCGIMYQGSIGAVNAIANFTSTEQPAESTPNGFWYKPYGGLAIYRQDEWMVSWKGNSRYIWDFESSSSQNRYGQFASAGVMRIYGDGSPITAEESGYTEDGWNWARPQGATCYDFGTDDFDGDTDRNFTATPFLGGVSIDGEVGLVAMDYQDPLNSLQAYESLFFIDNYIFSLGSNVSSSGEAFDVHTTLFQSALQGDNDAITADGEEKTTSYLSNNTFSLSDSESHTLTDPYGNAYRVEQSASIEVEMSSQSSMTHNGKSTSTGTFATARIVYGENPTDAGYEYAVHVKGGTAGAEYLAANKDSIYAVIQKDETAHIVEYLPNTTKAYAIFESNMTLDDELLLKADVPCLAMITSISASDMKIAVTNPDLGKFEETVEYGDIDSKETWHKSSSVQPACITLAGYWKLKADDDDISLVNKSNQTTEITFQCFDGQSISTELLSLDTSITEEGASIFSLSPNPSQDNIYLSNPTMMVGSMQILDLSGRCIYRAEVEAVSKQKIDISNLPTGVYTLRVTSESKTETIKFVKAIFL